MPGCLRRTLPQDCAARTDAEHTVYDWRTARPVTHNLADYALPVHADSPRIEACFIDRPDSHINTLGCRGIGELSITGAAGTNAVHHATGKRSRALPITTDKLLRQDTPSTASAS